MSPVRSPETIGFRHPVNQGPDLAAPPRVDRGRLRLEVEIQKRRDSFRC